MAQEKQSDNYPSIPGYYYQETNGDIYNKKSEHDKPIPSKNQYRAYAEYLRDFYRYIVKNLPSPTNIDYEFSNLQEALTTYVNISEKCLVLELAAKDKGDQSPSTEVKPYWTAFKETYKTEYANYKSVGTLLEKSATYTSYNGKYINTVTDRYRNAAIAQEIMTWVNKINKNILTAAKKGNYSVKIEKIPKTVYDEIFSNSNKINLKGIGDGSSSRDFIRGYNGNNDGARFIIKNVAEMKKKDGTSYDPVLYSFTISWIEKEIKWYFCPNTYDTNGNDHTTTFNGGYSASNYTAWYNYGKFGINQAVPAKTNWKKNDAGTDVISKIDEWWKNWNEYIIAPYDLTPVDIYGDNIEYPIKNNYKNY